MAQWQCKNCNRWFERPKRGRVAKYCTYQCYIEYKKKIGLYPGSFSKGLEPWNKNLKGIHLSPDTEFKKGQISLTHLEVGSIRIRKRKNRYEPARAWIKIAEPNVWILRARYVWEKQYGKIPKGLLVHHIDHNPLNDKITNLCLINRSSHLIEHFKELLNGRIARK